MTGPPARSGKPTSPSAVGPVPDVSLEIRWPDGRPFDSRRKVNEDQARLLVKGGVCDEVRSPTGILRYLKLRRNPPLKKFLSLQAQANFTTTQTGNLHEHVRSKQKGL